MYGLGRAARLPRGEAAQTAVMLCQVGEFAFVLIGFVASGRVIGQGLAAFLTAAVALSMGLTPLAALAFDQLAQRWRNARPRAAPQNKPFDDSTPDAIIAGFGRFGQIAGRLLTANGFSTVVLDSSIEQVETLRRFGRRVHYGDATRLDLLRQAGAAKAKLLVVAIDDRDEASRLVESAKAAFPGLTILARAWDRRHAYDLLRNGADAVERETFESALKLGVRALHALGFRAHRAHRAGSLFRQHDLRAFNELAPVAGEEERYILAVRDSQSTMERLLKADLDRLRPDYVDEAWDVTGLNDELAGRGDASPEASPHER
jgi:glutathione-regulated potassium-efflux system ancillary protein KefC/glutathione-regulated potassium-efflux system protein KefB